MADPNPSERIRVLVVEDERDVLEPTRQLLQGCGYEVFNTTSAEEAYRYFESVHPHVLVVDYKLPGMNGSDFVRHAKNADPKICAVMVTGLIPQVASIESLAKELGVVLLRKPIRLEELQQAIEGAVRQRGA
ncbi:MAG: response regulator [Candidatus Omnitrophica bacterium]|nr:response regulator [Candidatus Omnitrophota bacterium]